MDDTAGYDQEIICNLGDTGTGGFRLCLRNSKICFIYGDGIQRPKHKENIVYGCLIRPGFWYHIGITCNKTAVRIFVNGEMIKEEMLVNGCVLKNPFKKFTIGNYIFAKNAHAYPFKGSIDELEIYSVAIPVSEMEKLTFNPEF